MPHTAPSLMMAMQDELVQLEREGVPERVIEDYAVWALKITHDVQGVMDQQQRQLAREMDAIRERESFFAAHVEHPQRIGEAS